MKLVSIRHRGLARFVEKNDSSKLDKRLIGMEHSDECRSLPFWKAHQLSDDRWSFHVTANYRLTFAAHDETQEIHILDLEDYH